jgi:LysM repeat protein
MKRTLLFFVLMFSACAPQPIDQTPVPPGNLVPYFTLTPSLTPDVPDGLVIAFETPLPSPTPFAYEVQSGDTLSEIAEKFSVSLDELIAANPDVSPNSMSIGTMLNIPSNPANLTGAAISTPVPALIEQIECYPTADEGMWCFVLAHNDTANTIENLSAQMTLVDENDRSIASAQALSPLNILPPGASLPLMVFFAPVVPENARPQAHILTGIRLLPGDARYLPATLHNTLAQIDSSGRNAQVSGTIRLPEESIPASLVWVAAVAYDDTGRVVGVRRWESTAGIQPGGSLQFAFEISGLAREIENVEFVGEARP